MAVRFSGSICRSGGITSAIAKETRKLSLKPVKRIVFQFDPFVEESKHTRDFMYYLQSKKVIKTNPNCVVKSNVLCDRGDPSIAFNLENGSSVLFKAKHLSTLEMFRLYNKHITTLLPKEVPTTILKTKSEKAKKR
ncbi:39S ribosomal protein L53, mitochondrial-like [Macrosteles quadrilineatus]|uniref:39S ribosomal protein L53, mitochondrial-like n=1 Tax=Macrosteles quadrilineatus TaxID=74068 RepID=UPI0023E34783|nr:39S ribosomal protein L53, mitochondrial-like [Macrosteles quadrilineatus]XP_054269336.1 39S ribosomal protein L53, mitochondrial-like [Macrosteles quadrilineatus]